MTDTPARKKLGLKARPDGDTTSASTATRSGPRARMAQERQRTTRAQTPQTTPAPAPVPADAAEQRPKPTPVAAPTSRPPRSAAGQTDTPRSARSTRPPRKSSDDARTETGRPPRSRPASDRPLTTRSTARSDAPLTDDDLPPSQRRREPRPDDRRSEPRDERRDDRRGAQQGRPPRSDRAARTERPAEGRSERPAEGRGERRPSPRSARDSRPTAPQRAAPPLTAGLFRWFAPCPRGLESVLAQELTQCEAQDVRIVPGGCQFVGALRVGYLVNLHSRIASRVLREVKQANYHNEHDVFDAALAIDWPALFAVNRTIKVETVGIHPQVPSLEFVTLRVKDAICDRMRDATGKRPDIDTRTPDVRVHAFLNADIVTFYLDTSGEALFKRGWRHDKVEAPLRENLAAGLLALLEWQPGTPLLDPFCGSGTIAIEAGWIAQHRPPGLTRHFAFERLANFDAALWQSIVAEARARQHADAARDLYASDISIVAVPIARANAEHAAVPIELRQIDAQHLQPPGDRPGLIVCNPPYGERISVRGKRAESEDDAEFFANFASTLKQRFAGWHVAILSSDPALTTKLHLKPRKTWALFNGALPCKLYLFDMVSGNHRGR